MNIKTEEVQEITQEIVTAQQQALALKVINNETYSLAGQLLVAHKELKKRIEDYFKPLKENAHRAWKAICNRENEEIAKLEPAIKHLNSEIVKYNTEQERIRQEKEAQLRQEAKKLEEERRLEDAIIAETSGDKILAEAILNEPVFVPPPIVEKTVPKIAGQAMREYWDFEIINESLIPRQYMQPNLIAIRATVTSLKGKTNISGIKVVKINKMVGVRT